MKTAAKSAAGRTLTSLWSTPDDHKFIGKLQVVNYKTTVDVQKFVSVFTETYAATVAVVISDHGPFSPRVLTQRAM
jgi:hypothetical protein